MSWSPRAGQPAPPAVPQRRPVYRPTLSPPVVIPASPGWWRTWWAPVLQLVALASITLTASAFAQHQSGVIAADVAADRGAGVRIALARKVIHAAAPVSVSIPALHARSSLIDLRRQPDGTLQVPKNPAQAGWYVGSSHPGDPGPTVIAGHVDSRKGPGIFYHLDHLRKGDVITVGRADRSALRFVVTQVMKVSKRAFPTALVYVGTRSPSLRLISCGGDFDRASGHYLSNIVVLAVPAKAPAVKKPTAKAPAVKKLPPVKKPTTKLPAVTKSKAKRPVVNTSQVWLLR